MHASRLSGWPVWGRKGSGRERERAMSKDWGIVNPWRERSHSKELESEEVNKLLISVSIFQWMRAILL